MTKFPSRFCFDSLVDPSFSRVCETIKSAGDTLNANLLCAAVKETLIKSSLMPAGWLVQDLSQAVGTFNALPQKEESFVFTEPGQLGLELTGAAVTGVHGKAKELGIQAGDAFVAINAQPASEHSSQLIQQLEALPRPGTIVFRRADVEAAGTEDVAAVKKR
jgi:hypothetical protein